MPNPKDITPILREFDGEYRKSYNVVAGMDEAGRGPLAGPVVSACVIFDDSVKIPYINDSKKLSQKRRELLYDEIMKEATSVGVGIVDNNVIDEINILNATKRAMVQAVNSLSLKPDIILVDALLVEDIKIKQEAIIKGDAKSYSIAAASIVAKVVRDRMMAEYDCIYPGYNFSSHKGYGTKAHYEALEKLGICDIHRKTFVHIN